MKIRLYGFVPFLLLITYLMWDDDGMPEKRSLPTGMYLDTMQNEIMLMMENGQPRYYFSNVFTPVCNTGECLPVKVNFYWDLTGKYERFDQPEGEILTKLDHEPFTPDDYNLLREILNGPDPRYTAVAQHNDQPVKHNKNDAPQSQSQPAPAMTLKVSKYEMVDGITGSTLPEIKDKFVPGALYTTYTLWGLAHDSEQLMRKYTMENLIKPDHYIALLKTNNYQCTEMVLTHLAQKTNGQNPRTEVLLSFMDTGNVDLKLIALNQFYWNDYQMDDVQLTMHNHFYNSDNLELRKRILYRWAFNFISVSDLQMLSVNVHNNQDVMDEIVAIYLNKTEWPSDIFDNLVKEMDKLEPVNQQKLLSLFKSHRDYLSNEQWKTVKELEKSVE